MKTQFIAASLCVALMAFAFSPSAPAFAQDQVNVLAENSEVVVSEASLAPGITAQTPNATPPAWFVRYYLEGGYERAKR